MPRPLATPSTPRRAAAAALLALLLALATGCERRPADPYDREAVLLLAQLTQTLEGGDHATAMTHAAALQAVRKGDAAADTMVQMTAENHAMCLLNARLQAGDLPGAVALCDAQLRQVEQGAQLRASRPQLALLQAIAAYQHTPFPADASAAAAAVAALPTPTALGVPHPAYAAWYARQQELVTLQERRAQQRVREDLLARLDVALLTQDQPLAGLLASQLAQAAATSVERQWPSWVAGQLPLAQLQTLPDGRTRELALYLLERQDPAQAQRFYPAADAPPPLTLCGGYLQAAAALQRQDPIAAFVALRRLTNRVPAFDPAPLVRRARPQWESRGLAAPSPTVPQVLSGWYRFQAAP